MEHAFEQRLNLAGAYRNIQKAQAQKQIPDYGDYDKVVDIAVAKSIIERDQADLLKAYDHIRREVIAVDSFD
ncbi:MAG: acyl-CoA dehydrogenase domain-containing protein [Gammaproteobacteria bacterium]